MDDYKYKYSLNDGAGGYVWYNVTPDFGVGLAKNDVVVMEGVVCCKARSLTGLQFKATCAGHTWYVGATALNAKRGVEKKFTAKVDLAWGASSYARGSTIRLEEQFYNDNNEVYIYTVADSRNPPTYVNLIYHIDPQLVAFDIGRCDYWGNWDFQGNYIRCRKIKISVNPNYPQEDRDYLEFRNVAFVPDDGSARENLGWFGVPAAAFTEEGYSDPENWSEDGLFITGMVETTKSYSLEFDIFDAYESIHFVAARIPPAFARLHLSGAAKGGVGIGMFSTSTDDNPMFEVAENHQSIFYGPVEFRGSVSGGGGGTPGSMWYSGTALSASSGTTSSSALTGHYNVGDYYLNVNNGNFYRCTTAGTGSGAIWTYQGCLMGSAGAGSGSTVAVSEGGTGKTSLTAHGLLVANGTSAINVIGGSSTGVLYKTSTTSDPSFVSSLPVSYGGTGNTTLTNYGVLVGKGTSAIRSVGGGESGAVYKSSPATEPKIGTLPIAQGGTGATSASSALSNLGAAALSSTVTNVSVSGSTLYVYKGGSSSASSTYSLPSGGSSSSIPTASSTTKGAMYLYTGTGSNTDGTMTQKAITDAIASAGGTTSGGSIAYKSGESNTGDTWIDGKPIYRYVGTFSSLSSGAHDYPLPATISALISVRGFVHSGAAIYPIPNISSTNGYIIEAVIASSNMCRIRIGSSLSVTSGAFIVEYTKA